MEYHRPQCVEAQKAKTKVNRIRREYEYERLIRSAYLVLQEVHPKSTLEKVAIDKLAEALSYVE